MSVKKTLAGIATTIVLAGGGLEVADNTINPYTEVGEKLEIAKESSVLEAGEVKAIAHTDEPSITLQKWDGEIGLKVKYQGISTTTEGVRPFLSKNVEWKQDNITMEAVPLDSGEGHEDGGMEINIILDSKPDTNVFEFKLENTENLDFFYQPELTKEEINRGMSRPENVVGSYAVYYKDHANHKIGETNYATGKAYHIYRPKIIDAKGNEIWGELNYDNGVLSVTVDQTYLDNAVYPVKVDPTFGYTTQGASSESSCSNVFDGRRADRADSINGTLTDVNAYLKTNNPGNAEFLLVVYDNDGSNKPGTALVSGTPTTYSGTTYSLRTQSLALSLTGINYWVSAETNQIVGGVGCSIANDSGGTTNYAARRDSDAGPVWNLTTILFSVYATYTASAGATPNASQIRQSTGKVNQINGIIINKNR